MCNPLSLRGASPQEMTCTERSVAAIASLIVIGAVVFAILGIAQPNWFTSGVGFAGNPHSWALWTISGGSILIGAGLLTFAVLRRDKAAETGSPLLKSSILSKPTLAELFADDGDLLEKIPPSAHELQYGSSFNFAHMSRSVEKSRHKGDKDFFIAFRLKCTSSAEEIKQVFKGTPYLNTTGPSYLFLEWDVSGGQWKQFWEPEESSFMPVFLLDKLNSKLCKQPELEEQELGLQNLKQLMQSQVEGYDMIVTDNNNLKWTLA